MSAAQLEPIIEACFGSPKDPIELVDRRVQEQLADRRAIVWEGDAQTFQFTFVSRSAEVLLGHPVARWTMEPTFWADTVIAAADRDEAIAYCALATTKRAHHAFDYRAHTRDGDLVWLRDFVRVDVGPRGIARTLRGIMIDITDEKRRTGEYERAASFRAPSVAELTTMA